MSKIEKFKIPHCPYCKNSLWYSEAFLSKNKPVFKCSHCAHTSRVVLHPLTFKLLELAELISLVICALAIFKGGGFCIAGIVFITIVFGVFYCFSPFTITLEMLPDYENEYIHEEIKKVKNFSGEDTGNEIFSN